MILPLHIEISDKLRICESRLASQIDADDTALSVTSGDGSARFPTYTPFLVLIESEIVNVTAVSTDTFTIERGARGTTAATHTGATPLRAVVYSEDVGKINWFLVEKTDSYTATSSDCIILVDASGGDVTITLPAAEDSTNSGYIIKKIDTSGGKVTIDADESETIDGEESIDLTLQYQFVSIVCDGTEWFVIGGAYVKMEELLERKFNEQIDLLEKIRKEATKTTLHLASQSDENIGEKDAQ